MAATCTLRVHREPGAATFQVEGVARMPQGVALRRAAEEALAGGATRLHVDLRRCDYMDSTFTGTLLCLYRAAGRTRAQFALVCPAAPCGELLRQLGLDRLLPVVTADEPPAGAGEELADAADVGACREQVAQAHQELARLDSPAAEPFRAVVRCLGTGPGERGA